MYLVRPSNTFRREPNLRNSEEGRIWGNVVSANGIRTTLAAAPLNANLANVDSASLSCAK